MSLSKEKLIHGAYYWLRVERDVVNWGMKVGELYIGQFVDGHYPNGTSSPWFDICGTDNPPDMDYFEVLEIIEYRGSN
jgi:hypothetical protein